MNKAIILLSGGLDSAVALGAFKEQYGIEYALTFNYGQRTAQAEIEAAQNFANHYNIKHEVIELDWLRRITKTSLVSDKKIPVDNLGSLQSASNVWVPNRNGLFLNIAAAYADSFAYDYIIFGANKDEGATFPDNTETFRADITKVFESSTLIKPKVIAPLINCSKGDIVKIAIQEHVPLEYVRSCYKSNDKHCGKCESCKHLKNALAENCAHEYIKLLFENNEN